MSEGTVVIEKITSNVLRDNPLGDPFVRRVPVYLPPGYESGSTRYPAVYVLTGFTGRNVSIGLRQLLRKISVQRQVTVAELGQGNGSIHAQDRL